MKRIAYSRSLFLLCVGVIVEAAAFLCLRAVTHAHGQEMAFLTGDSGAYKIYAENFWFHHVFSFSSAAPYYPDSLRTPGYTIFAGILFGLTRSWDAVIFIQGLLVAVAPTLIYLIGRRLNERVAFVAALIFLFDPNRLAWSNTLMTDAPMTVLLLLALWFFLRWMETRTWQRLAWSGALLGLATMFRPVTMLLWVPWILVIVASDRVRNWKAWIRHAIIFVVSFTLVIAPWSIRNKITFNSWQLSAVGAYSFAYANAILYAHEKTGEPLQNLYDRFNALIDAKNDPIRSVSLERMDAYNRFAMGIVGNDLFGYARWHLLKSVPYFLTDGLREPAQMFGIISPATQPNLSNLFLHGQIVSGLRNYVRAEPVAATLLLFGSLFWLLVTVLAAASLVFEIRSRRFRPAVFLLALTVAYFFAVSSGPVSQARYRLPVEGILFLLSGIAVSAIWRVDNSASTECNRPAPHARGIS